MASCSGCYYHMRARNQCGWSGDVPPQPSGERCNLVPLQQARVPEGTVIAKSHRLVLTADLAAENESFADATGRLD